MAALVAYYLTSRPRVQNERPQLSATILRRNHRFGKTGQVIAVLAADHLHGPSDGNVQTSSTRFTYLFQSGTSVGSFFASSKSS